MIVAKNIKKAFGTLQVLKGVNLTIEQGEVVAIVGKSGAGKSTLLHILGTLDQPDVGEVWINNESVFTYNPKKMAAFRNRSIGFIFQFHHLLPEFNALENVMIPAFISNANTQEINREATRLLNYLGLGDRLTHRPSQLSGGEQQRVAVARALINKPTIILADEPSGNLDSASSEELHKLIFQLRKDFNQTFVIVTHNQDLANMSDRKVVMKDGVVV